MTNIKNYFTDYFFIWCFWCAQQKTDGASRSSLQNGGTNSRLVSVDHTRTVWSRVSVVQETKPLGTVGCFRSRRLFSVDCHVLGVVLVTMTTECISRCYFNRFWCFLFGFTEAKVWGCYFCLLRLWHSSVLETSSWRSRFYFILFNSSFQSVSAGVRLFYPPGRLQVGAILFLFSCDCCPLPVCCIRPNHSCKNFRDNPVAVVTAGGCCCRGNNLLTVCRLKMNGSDGLIVSRLVPGRRTEPNLSSDDVGHFCF